MEATRISHQLLAATGSPSTRYEPGEVIFSEGDKADKIYVVGDVEVHLQGTVIDTLTEGGTFGEEDELAGDALELAERVNFRMQSSCHMRPL